MMPLPGHMAATDRDGKDRDAGGEREARRSFLEWHRGAVRVAPPSLRKDDDGPALSKPMQGAANRRRIRVPGVAGYAPTNPANGPTTAQSKTASQAR